MKPLLVDAALQRGGGGGETSGVFPRLALWTVIQAVRAEVMDSWKIGVGVFSRGLREMGVCLFWMCPRASSADWIIDGVI